jgi:hypothetical protein
VAGKSDVRTWRRSLFERRRELTPTAPYVVFEIAGQVAERGDWLEGKPLLARLLQTPGRGRFRLRVILRKQFAPTWCETPSRRGQFGREDSPRFETISQVNEASISQIHRHITVLLRELFHLRSPIDETNGNMKDSVPDIRNDCLRGTAQVAQQITGFGYGRLTRN